MDNIFVNYDAITLKVLGSYGGEGNTPKPYIPILVDDWNNVYHYSVENLFVSSDLKSIYADAVVKLSIDTKIQIAEIDKQLNYLDLKCIRPNREITIGKDQKGSAKVKLDELESLIAELRAKRNELFATTPG